MFEKRKKEVMFKLAEAVAENKVDSEILETLALINSQKEYYTTSSCAGRIVLIWMPDLGDKKRSVFLGKWHRKIEYEELIESLEFRDSGVIFLISQSPIIHVASCDLKSAIKIRDLAFSCGFKNSGIKSITKKIVVEILSTERIDVPQQLSVGYGGSGREPKLPIGDVVKPHSSKISTGSSINFCS